MSNLLECKNLTKTFGSTIALMNVNLEIGRGRIVGLLGPNASGKTTFIKLCNDLLTPTRGEILIGGHKPGITTKGMVSYLPERTYLNDWMRVSDIIEFFKDFYKNFNPEKAYDMLGSWVSTRKTGLRPCPRHQSRADPTEQGG